MKKIILGNFRLKATAVVMAMILWFFVVSKGQSEISIEVPIELKNIPRTLESVKQGIKSVSVTIKGQERLLRNMKPSDIRVQVDLGKAKKGKGIYYINKDDVKLPVSMSITSITPSSVTIELEETVSKIVPVNAVISGSPKEGFTISSVEVSPKDISIEGVKTEIRNVKFLKAEPVDVSDAEKTFSQAARIDLAGRNIRTDVQEVNVKVVIKGQAKNRK